MPPVSVPFRIFLSRLACWAPAQLRSLGAIISRKLPAHRCCAVCTEQIWAEARRRPQGILLYFQGLERSNSPNLPAQTGTGSNPVSQGEAPPAGHNGDIWPRAATKHGANPAAKNSRFLSGDSINTSAAAKSFPRGKNSPVGTHSPGPRGRALLPRTTKKRRTGRGVKRFFTAPDGSSHSFTMTRLPWTESLPPQ